MIPPVSPDGLTSPIRTSTAAGPPACPARQHSSTDLTPPIQGMVTGRAVLQHHHGMGIRTGHRRDQVVMALGHIHMDAIKPLGLVFVGEPREYHGHIGLLCRSHRFFDQIRVGLIGIHQVSGTVVYVHTPRDKGIVGAFQPGGVHQGTAASLVAGFFRKRPDEGDLGVTFEREHIAVILQ